MKKISAETTSVLSIILLAAVCLFAVGQLIFCLIAAPTVLGWLKSAHVAYYSASTAVAPKMTAYIMNQSFENLFSNTYIRVMSMYVFVLCVPLAYALLNIFFISQNGQSEKPFRSSTGACLRVISISFIGEFLVATVLFIILRIIMRALPFYFMYTMIAVALYSLTMLVFSLTISGLINRMGDLRNEHAKKVKREKYKKAAVAAHEPISVKERPEPEEEKPIERAKPSASFDDVLNSIEEQ
ncbi:MAG: hypothetical protein IJJ41_00580 [Clostridia bacterium]|nr:hypothetical protein [Clostridia bacterium]